MAHTFSQSKNDTKQRRKRVDCDGKTIPKKNANAINQLKETPHASFPQFQHQLYHDVCHSDN